MHLLISLAFLFSVTQNMATSSVSSATAGVLRDFLPIYDTLNSLHEKYANDEFGRSYTELTLGKTFANLGVVDYNVAPGEAVNNFRMKVLESEVSTEFAKDTVIRQVAPGLELDGNVIRAAACVSSSGSGEENAEESTSDDEGGEGAE
jgi:molecular chaperone GrpE (heat shock protein)